MAFSTPRLSNRASPYYRPSTARARSPVREDQSLSLKQVIGTTATSNNGFSSINGGVSFAFIAGSGAVCVTLTKGAQTKQRFYHARPAANPLVTTPSIYDSPTPLAQQGSRQRTAASLRESGYGAPSTNSPFHDATDSPGARNGGNTRSKAATCVALSPDSKLLAIGETGHKPRVLIFSTAKDSPRDTPQNALSEHTFGVRCLAFSPDSQYLASLGDINDGFLYIWTINQRNGTALLKASNKCTSNVRQIAWMGNNLVTVGTRHVKVWRLDQPSSSPSKRFSDVGIFQASPSGRTLIGRNCLLGPLLDKTFTAVEPISHVQAIVCSDVGDVCLLDDSDPAPSFTKIADAGFSITALTAQQREFVLISGTQGQLELMNIVSATGLLLADSTLTLEDAGVERGVASSSPIIAQGLVKEGLVLIDQARGIHICRTDVGSSNTTSFPLEQCFPAHPGAVLGIRSLPSMSTLGAFMTWSADGTVLSWSAEGLFISISKVALDQLTQQTEEYTNELKIAHSFCKGRYLVSGDRLGVLRITEIASNRTCSNFKAHCNEITDIAIHESDDDVLIASSSRDRTVQLFRWSEEQNCQHLQTIEEHTGAVSSVSFSGDGNSLISASSDRTLMVLDAVPHRSDGRGKVLGFLTRRPITLKAAPLSVQLADDQDALLVSTTDRQIQKFDLISGSPLTSFKASDQDGQDAVALASIVQLSLGKKSTLIAGVSTSDKSIRVYDSSGRLLSKEHGHTEGMMGVALLHSGENSSQRSSAIVTVASDGTIFLWDLVQSGQEMQEAFAAMSLTNDVEHSPGLLSSRPPLRKVLSSSELTRLHGLREEKEGNECDSQPIAKRPLLKRKTSNLSRLQTPKLEPSPGLGSRRVSAYPSPSIPTLQSKRSMSSMVRSPSPTASTRKTQTMRTPSRSTPMAPAQPRVRRKSMSAASSPSAPNALTVATDSLCRSLQSYRKKLSSSSDLLALDSVRELERELSLTAKVVAQKHERSDTVMAKILDQYSERLVGILDGKLDEKIEASIARQMRRRLTNGNDETYDDNDETQDG